MKRTLLLLITILFSLTSFGSVYLFDKTICQNDVGTETWSTTSGTSSYQWYWYKFSYSTTTWNPVGYTPSGTSSSHNVTITDTGYYKIVRKTSGGTLVDSDYSHLTITPTPNSGIMYGGDTVCNGSSITLYDTGYIGSSLSNGWEIPTNSNVSSSNTLILTNSTVITGTHPGLDTIYFTTTNMSSFSSCGIDTTMKVITILPTSSGVITGNDTVCMGHTITLSDTVNVGIWSTGSHTTITSSGLLYGVSVGSDTVKYSVVNSCGNYITTKVIEVKDCSSTGIYMTEKNKKFEVFPNPTNDIVTVSGDIIITDIVVTNMIGQTLFTGTFTNKIVQIDISHLQNGLYFLSINKNEVIRLVKQ